MNIFNFKHKTPESIIQYQLHSLLNNIVYEPDGYVMYMNLKGNNNIFSPLLELKNNKLDLYEHILF